VEPATQPVYTAGAATVPAPPEASPVPGNGVAALPVPAAHGYTPGYAAESGTSAFPVTGVPVSGYPMMPVAAPKKKRTGTIILAVATIVLGLATAGFGTMYFLEASAHDKADKKISEQTALLADADKKLKETESNLSTSKEENAKLNQDLTGAKNKTDEVTKARDALAACMAASDAYVANKNSSTARDVIVKCAEAEKYY
jgi:flagellar basal body-associated protein FliL